MHVRACVCMCVPSVRVRMRVHERSVCARQHCTVGACAEVGL